MCMDSYFFYSTFNPFSTMPSTASPWNPSTQPAKPSPIRIPDGLLKTKTDHRDKDRIDREVLERLKRML